MWGMPEFCKTIMAAQRIGKKLGEVMKADKFSMRGKEDWNMKIRVNMDVTKTLCQSIKVASPDNAVFEIMLKYEKLGIYCGFCGYIGHEARNYGDLLKNLANLSFNDHNPKHIHNPPNSQIHLNQTNILKPSAQYHISNPQENQNIIPYTRTEPIEEGGAFHIGSTERGIKRSSKRPKIKHLGGNMEVIEVGSKIVGVKRNSEQQDEVPSQKWHPKKNIAKLTSKLNAEKDKDARANTTRQNWKMNMRERKDSRKKRPGYSGCIDVIRTQNSFMPKFVCGAVKTSCTGWKVIRVTLVLLQNK
ncbi:hypothetical protein Ahy_B08g091002 [Arachis hypogaea]|uniref:Zinc knuckle CX2CX4HX4C domain-containing protein n=1 Tax=Arachis hypogaea TaxID=3818 RepID=A0A444Y170_ARAHY|nr:hypothetical protein Ahy_B08g091002 [Arachis hypogaea]